MADQNTLNTLALNMISTLPTWGVWAASLREVTTPHGRIGYRQTSILWALRYKLVPESEQSTTGLAAYLGVQNSVVARSCVPLEQLGLVQRIVHADDRRRSTIVITPEGIEASKYIENLYVRSITNVISQLDDHTIEELQKSTAVLHTILSKLMPSPPGS